MVHCEKVFERKTGEGISCGYVARVRVRVRANATTILREGTGFGQATAATQGDAHERALKAAETDATKRALVTFGGRFGLMLYDKEQRPETRRRAFTPDLGVVRESNKPTAGDTALDGRMPLVRPDRVTYGLVASDGSSSEVHSPESFCAGLRQLIEAARSASELARLRWENEPTLCRLRQMPDLVSSSRRHYADILERLIEERSHELASSAERARAQSVPGAEMLAGAEIETVTGSTIASAVETEPGPAALEAAITQARPVDDGEVPKFYEPFVPVPAYPLARLSDRFRAAKLDTKAEMPDQNLELHTPSSPTLAQEASAPAGETTSRDSTPVPTRRSQITGGFSIDKSALLVPSERRLRSKAHLQFVASKPCLICEALPCHAHHITFAQPRGLSQKVSDEFTVPLCAVHHNELHALGNEASWWRGQGIEPVSRAGELWRETWRALHPNVDDQA